MTQFRSLGVQMLQLLAAAVLYVGLGGCTSALVETEALSTGLSGPVEGVAYALPKTIVNVTVTQSKSARKESYKLGEPEIKTSPDARHQYVARVNESGWSADKVKLVKGNFSESGTPNVNDTYMATVDASADDKTADVLKNAAKSFATVFYGIPGGFRAEGHSAAPTKEMRLEFDPSDPNELARVNHLLAANGMRVKFVCIDCGVLTPTLAGGTTIGGVVYRAKRPITVALNGAEPSPAEIARFEVLSYNTSPLLFAKVERNTFTKTDTKIFFAEGSLAKYDVDKGSEFENAAALPGDVVGLLLQGPTEALTGRKQRIVAEKELLTEQIELVKRKTELAKALKDLQGPTAPSSNPDGTPAPPPAPTDQDKKDAGD